MLQNYILTRAETNSSHLPGSYPKRKLIFQPSIFRCYVYVSFRESILKKNNETKTEIATVPQLTRKHFTKKNKKNMVEIDKNKFQIEFNQELRYKVGPYQL